MSQLIEKYIFSSAEEQMLYDLKAKSDMAKHVVRLCLDHQYDLKSNQNLLLKAAAPYYSNNILAQLILNAVDNKSNITYNSWNEQMLLSNFDDLANSNTDIFLREILVTFYLSKMILPTKDNISNLIMNTNKTLTKSSIELCMKTRGYKSKRLPQCTKSIIVEDPEHSWARIKYLQSIQQFRNAGAHIIYIEEKLANDDGSFLETLKGRNEDVTLFNISVSSTMGMINNMMTHISKNKIPDFEDDYDSFFIKWILDNVVPQVAEPSVFVLEEKAHNSSSFADMPTMYSSRNIMINWLENNDIPHNLNMHSAELFELIKRTKRNFVRKNILDENLISHGHKVLRRPSQTNYLNYFNIHWDKLSNIPNSLKMNLFNETSINDWQKMEAILVEIERKTLEEDIAVLNTIEKIFTYAKHERVLYDSKDVHPDEFRMEKIVRV